MIPRHQRAVHGGVLECPETRKLSGPARARIIFTKEGEVALRVCKVADGRDWVELAVADTGIGMTAEQ